MVTISAFEAIPKEVDPEARVLYFSPDPAGDQLGKDTDFETLRAADFLGGRFIVKHIFVNMLAVNAHNRLTVGGRRGRNFKAADNIARRAVAGVIMHAMGAKDDETSEICGVHYNVPGNDRRRVRAFMGATSDSAVIHKAFSKDDFRVTYPIEADFTSHTPAELAALRWLAAGKPATQVDLLTRNRPLFTCTGPQPELVSAPGRTILSRAWGRLGVDNEVSATLYLQLANNLPPYEPVRD